MKKVLFTLLATISFTTFSQSQFPTFEPSALNTPPSVNTALWNKSMKFDTPQLNLQYGVSDLIIADNLMYASVALSVISTFSYADSVTSDGDAGVLVATTFGIGSAACIIASMVHRRRGLQRLYWGANGITIPLNQQ